MPLRCQHLRLSNADLCSSTSIPSAASRSSCHCRRRQTITTAGASLERSQARRARYGGGRPVESGVERVGPTTTVVVQRWWLQGCIGQRPSS
ncbi:hypothetical protein GUJ93_ZPchr0011g28362 [Zizania palustris]|uniref:Uncharacterized protein n=1 Tax=Zizania palustris TaxID=103762 RepID=A0A8J6BSN5_ZIZPA|nr:hypothetical protein GUJ93_ZPchr0011g28362 [Zizania palustris]